MRQLQEDAIRLQSAYAGDKADDIQKRESEVLEAWKSLLESCEERRVRLTDTGDKFRFFSMVRDLMLWMEDVIRLIEAQEKPRCRPRGSRGSSCTQRPSLAAPAISSWSSSLLQPHSLLVLTESISTARALTAFQPLA